MRKYIVAAALLLTQGVSLATDADTLVIVQKKCATATSLPNGGRAECNIISACPQTDNMQFNNSFATWLGETAKMFSMPDASSSLLLATVEQMFYLNLKKEMASVTQSSKNQMPYNVAMDVEVRKMHEKKGFITFRQDWIYYSAQGSRSEIVRERTFLKITGESPKWTDVILPKRRTQFNKAVIAALEPFFGVRDLDNLKSKLKNGDAVSYQNFPLPAEGPCFESAGLRIIYALDEIASSEVGHPSALIPYSSIMSCLTSYAKKQIK